MVTTSGNGVNVDSSPPSAPTSTTAKIAQAFGALLTRENLSKVGSLLATGGVAALRYGVIPVAGYYARPTHAAGVKASIAPDASPPSGTLTATEKDTLTRAANKLMLEGGDMLVAKYAPDLGPAVPPDRTFVDVNGNRGEPTLAMAVAAVRA